MVILERQGVGVKLVLHGISSTKKYLEEEVLRSRYVLFLSISTSISCGNKREFQPKERVPEQVTEEDWIITSILVIASIIVG